MKARVEHGQQPAVPNGDSAGGHVALQAAPGVDALAASECLQQRLEAFALGGKQAAVGVNLLGGTPAVGEGLAVGKGKGGVMHGPGHDRAQGLVRADAGF